MIDEAGRVQKCEGGGQRIELTSGVFYGPYETTSRPRGPTSKFHRSRDTAEY